MTQKDFYKGTIAIMDQKAHDMNPESLANAIYFHMKQNPKNVKVDKAWGVMLKNIKILLSQHFEWDMMEIHQVFTKLRKLTQYMQKSA